MSVALAFRSAKLCHKTSKLGVRTRYYPCTVDFSQTGYSYSSAWNNTGNIMTAWPYTTAVWEDAMWLLANEPQYSTAMCVAQLRTDHSHGLSQYNECAMSGGTRGFIKPTEVSGTVTAGFLRIYNCGSPRHTIISGSPGLLVNAYDGYMAILGDANFYLSLLFYADATHYYEVVLTLAQIRTLNAANGIISANMGRYTYMRNGYVDVTLPSQVLTLLSTYTGLYLDMAWYWGEVSAGGYCPYCFDDYVYTGYQSSIDACAMICTSNMLAQNPELYVS